MPMKKKSGKRPAIARRAKDHLKRAAVRLAHSELRKVQPNGGRGDMNLVAEDRLFDAILETSDLLGEKFELLSDVEVFAALCLGLSKTGKSFKLVPDPAACTIRITGETRFFEIELSERKFGEFMKSLAPVVRTLEKKSRPAAPQAPAADVTRT